MLNLNAYATRAGKSQADAHGTQGWGVCGDMRVTVAGDWRLCAEFASGRGGTCHLPGPGHVCNGSALSAVGVASTAHWHPSPRSWSGRVPCAFAGVLTLTRSVRQESLAYAHTPPGDPPSTPPPRRATGPRAAAGSGCQAPQQEQARGGGRQWQPVRDAHGPGPLARAASLRLPRASGAWSPAGYASGPRPRGRAGWGNG
jgi:hypothetical protein